MRQNYRSLQYLRAVAALLVVIAHTTEYPVSAAVAVPSWTARTSELGVQIFFAISGFIIFTVAGAGRFDPVTFAWRRFLRVAPLYWICTTALFLVASVFPALFKTTQASAHDYVLSLLFIPHTQLAETIANLWSPLLKPGWTLNLEVFFYAVVAALFWCRRRRMRAILLTLVLGALVALSLRQGPQPGVLDFYASRNWIPFVFGVWLAEAAAAVSMDRLAGALAPVAAAAAALVAATYMVGESAGAQLACPAALLIVTAAVLTEKAMGLPDWKPLRIIGDASYSLYLTHMFTVGITWALVRRFASPDAWPVHAGGTILSTLFALAVALLSYRLIERPFLRLSRSTQTPSPDARLVASPTSAQRPAKQLESQGLRPSCAELACARAEGTPADR